MASMDRRQLLTGIGGVTMAALAGCSGNEDNDQATLWHDFTDSEEASLETHIESFNSDREAEINVEEVPEIVDQLETAIPSGEGPETFAWAHDWIGTYYEQDFAYDGSGDISIDLEATFTESAVEAVQWEGGVYGIPYAAETVSLMYNEEMVDEPPGTLDEMVEIMEDHHDPDQGQYGLSCPPADAYFTSTFTQAFGSQVFNPETEDTEIDDEGFIEGIELLEENIWPYVPADANYDPQVSVFDDGNAPLAINGPWEVEGFRDSGNDITVVPMPEIDGGNPTPYTGIQVWYFTTNLSDIEDQERETTIDWAEWHATNENVILSNAENHGYIPIHQDYVDSEELEESVEAFAENVEMGLQLPSHPRADQIWNPLEDGLEQVFNGSADAEEAMEAAAEEIRGRWE